MKQENENIWKTVISLVGGFVVFLGVKYLYDNKKNSSKTTSTSTSTSSFDSTKKTPSLENVDIVTSAYGDAVKAGEPASRLTELNKELMKEFGMRCYMDKDKKLVVCDSSGTIITTK